MYAVDTNVLVRYLLQDAPEKGPAAARLLDGAEQLGVSLVTLAETAFVLSRVYGVPRAHGVEALYAFDGRASEGLALGEPG